MRILFALFLTLGLILNSGGGALAGAHAQTPGNEHAVAHSHHDMHELGEDGGGCHKTSPQAPADTGKCCKKAGKCGHESCSCDKCFNVLADLRPNHNTAFGSPPLLTVERFDKPSGDMRHPPPPPPQA